MFLTAGVGGNHHILQRRDPPDEVELLEDESEGGAPDLRQESFREARDLPVEELDPPGCGSGHAPDKAQKRRLSGAARTLEDGHTLRLNGEVDPFDGRKLIGPALVEDFLDVEEFDHINTYQVSVSVSVSVKKKNLSQCQF